MGKKEETTLQENIQKVIERRGGYVNKNWGSMISAPGIADLTVCYKGLYLAIEVKVGDNKPSKAQGIHARMVWKANGITAVVWSTEEVIKILDIIDKEFDEVMQGYFLNIRHKMSMRMIDNGRSY